MIYKDNRKNKRVINRIHKKIIGSDREDISWWDTDFQSMLDYFLIDGVVIGITLVTEFDYYAGHKSPRMFADLLIRMYNEAQEEVHYT